LPRYPKLRIRIPGSYGQTKHFGRRVVGVYVYSDFFECRSASSLYVYVDHL
jgi:hypothetical protein